MIALSLGCTAPVSYAYRYRTMDNDRAVVSFQMHWDNTFDLRLRSLSGTSRLNLKITGIWVMDVQSDTVQISAFEINFKNIDYESIFCFPYFRKISPNTFKFCIHKMISIWGAGCELVGSYDIQK